MDLSEVVKNKDEAFYFYDLDGILERVEKFKNSFSCNIKIHYAVKANSHPLLLKSMAEVGLGVDIVSGGELRLAQEAGFSSKKIIFSGVGKTKSELKTAISEKIKHINVESLEELNLIGELAEQLKSQASVVVRLNPDVNPKTHPYICTGFRENKFGFDVSQLPEIKKIISKHASSLRLSGLSLHIGSQICDIEPFRESIDKIFVIYKNLLRDGYELDSINIGGGLGVQYDDHQDENDHRDLELLTKYSKAVSEIFSDFKGEVLTEPGRFLTAPFGVLLTEVLYTKKTPHKNFLIVNTGMHHLLRPALYQAFHRILPLVNEAKGQKQLYDVVGPICESSDVVGRDRLFHEIKSGNWLAVMDVGAYGRSMSSNYNSHELPAEVLCSKGQLIFTNSN